MTFDEKGYMEFILRLQATGVPITPLEECYDPTHQNVISIRHDVDDNLMASVAMAKLEKAMGVRSTYFMLDTAPYWNINALRPAINQILQAGHYIGWHNNAITTSVRTGRSLKECIEEPLAILRRMAHVFGTASHGDPLCHELRYLNYYAFDGCRHDHRFTFTPATTHAMTDFGLKYEAYHTGKTHYISDSGGEWHHSNEPTMSDFEALQNHQENAKLQILIHPQWWRL